MHPPASPPPSAPVATQAADWLARRDAGLSAAESAALQAWLAAAPEHAQAYRDLDATWRVFDARRIQERSAWMVRELGHRQQRRVRRRVGVAAASLGAAAVVAFLFVRPLAPSGAGQVASSGVVWREPEHQVLSDGSIVELNRGARIAVHYTAEVRAIDLLAGEACFTVTKNPNRPFVVSAGNSTVRAVGTVFVVDRQPQAVGVLVTEGRIAAAPTTTSARTTSTPAPATFVSAGYKLALTASAPTGTVPAPQSVTPADLDRLAAWRASRLELSGTPLAEVAAAFNRAGPVQLTISTPELGALRLTGVFRADRVEDFVRILESHYGVRVTRRSATEWVLGRTS